MLLLVFSQTLYGQTPNNPKASQANIKIVMLDGVTDTTITEKYTIVPSSIVFQGVSQSKVSYTIRNNQIDIKNLPESVQSISYRIFDFNVFESSSALNPKEVSRDERIMLLKPNKEDSDNERKLISSSELQYRGNFTRGISFGNTQDVVLNSNLNLQLSGDLGNGLILTAAISDENIPLQPEGNTQVLQEFNKIFIEIEKDNTQVIAGDYEIGRPNSHFMNYFKKLKGISVTNRQAINSEWYTENKASFAVSRGKFRRVFLQIQEGNQGPYRLEGENGEIFIQVLSGTEKIWADGQLLQRGENNDYIIDYNRAEIRFTPKRIITANLRIIVEFEYAVQNYLRSLIATESVVSNNKWTFRFNSYSEQDSKSTSGNIELDSTDLRILREGGDNETFRSGIFQLDENTTDNTVTYRLNNGILSYAPSDSSNVFGARFSNFGNNAGDYIIDSEAGANGRVYRYVGENQGSFLPLINLIPPEQKQLFTASGEVMITDSTRVFVETALSSLDRNRFSEIDNEDNTGSALTARITDTRQLSDKYHLESDIRYEYTSQNFQFLNPFRVPEFNRDWNLDMFEERNTQKYVNGQLKFGDKQSDIYYNIQSFSDQNNYTGIRHIPRLKHVSKKLNIDMRGDWLSAEYNNIESNFSRPRINAKYEVIDDQLELGFYLEKEKNTFLTDADTLSNASFNYDLYRFHINNRLSDKHAVELAYSTRTDDRIINGSLQRVTEGQNIELKGFWNEGNTSQLQWQLALRDFEVEEEFLEFEQAKKAFIGNVDHKLSILSKALSINSYYESNTGQEPRLEFQYVQVQQGEGSYIWNDYNMDSIQQINEFEIAPFSDLASFEKISVFNNEFISTNRQVLNQSIRFNPKRIQSLRDKWLGRIYFFSRYRIDQKNQSQGGQFFNFIDFDHNSDELVSYSSSFDHTLFLNRGQPEWDVQLSYRSIHNKSNQISGAEQRQNKEYFARTRLNLHKQLDLLLAYTDGILIRRSENFNNQNFDIDSRKYDLQLNFRPSSKFRLIGKTNFEKRNNALGSENENANILTSGIELSWRQTSTSNLEFNFDLVSINFEGDANSPVAFEMLKGLDNGSNILIGLNYTRRVSKSIDLILLYNGRKPAENPLINTASVQMRAIF